MGQGLSRNGARPAYLSPQRSDRGGRVETPDCQHFPRVRSPVGAARHGAIADANEHNLLKESPRGGRQ